ncbi:hypothetical protein C8J57DRAFT_1236921 [Mycena rebaudengoi]|nr:hypothetical protein C8J57DRAFT_1236921 [Mycena rebaudengoi]
MRRTEVDTNSLPQDSAPDIHGDMNLSRVECNLLYLISISFQNRSQDRSRHIVLKSSVNSEAFHAKIPRVHRPLGLVFTWSTAQNRMRMSKPFPCHTFSELSELNPNLASSIVLGEEVDDMCGGITQQVSCSNVESCSVGVLVCVEGIMERVAGRVRKWFLGEEFGGLWVMLPHLAIRNGGGIFPRWSIVTGNQVIKTMYDDSGYGCQSSQGPIAQYVYTKYTRVTIVCILCLDAAHGFKTGFASAWEALYGKILSPFLHLLSRRTRLAWDILLVGFTVYHGYIHWTSRISHGGTLWRVLVCDRVMYFGLSSMGH